MKRIEDCVEIILKETHSYYTEDKKFRCYFGLATYRYLRERYNNIPIEVENAAILIDFYSYTKHKKGFLEKQGFLLRTEYIVSFLEKIRTRIYKETEEQYLNRIVNCYDIWVSKILHAKYYILYKHYSEKKYLNSDLAEKYRALSVKLLKNIK